MCYAFLEEMINGMLSNFSKMYQFSDYEKNSDTDIDSDIDADVSAIKAEEKRLL